MKIESTKVVFSDWLRRHSGNTELFADEAEKYVLWHLETQLEKELVEPFFENYSEILAIARGNVKQGDSVVCSFLCEV